MEQKLLELLDLPEPEQLIVFERTPLLLAICQVRFTRVLGVAQTAFVAPFQSALQHLYPVLNQTQDLKLEVTAGPAGAQLQQERGRYRWEFADAEDTWKVVLAEDFLAIETRSYESFSDFLERLRTALAALMDHIHPALGTRIGLRYVNEIRIEDRVLTDIVNSRLLGPLAGPELAGGVCQSIQEIRLRYPDSHGVTIRHGLFPGGSTVKPRAGQQPDSGPFYLLDLDAFREFQLPGALPMDVDMICNYVEGFNRAIYHLFRWLLSPRYTAELGVRRYATV